MLGKCKPIAFLGFCKFVIDQTHLREIFMGRKYRAAGVKNCNVVLIPRDGHVGYAELNNEKIAYLWLWAFKNGYFTG